jgi:ABC-type multidrug transport system ATPase subunit
MNDSPPSPVIAPSAHTPDNDALFMMNKEVSLPVAMAIAPIETEISTLPKLRFWKGPALYVGQLYAFAVKSALTTAKNWRTLAVLFVVCFLLLNSLVLFEVLLLVFYGGDSYSENQHPTAYPFVVNYNPNINAKSPPFYYYLGKNALTMGAALMTVLPNPTYSLLPGNVFNNYQTPYPAQPNRIQSVSIHAMEKTLYDRFDQGDDIFAAVNVEGVSADALHYNIYYNKTFGLKDASSFGQTIEAVNVPAFINSMGQAYFGAQVLQTLQWTNATFNTLQKNFPNHENTVKFDVQAYIGAFYYMFIFVLMLPLFTTSIVADKERKLFMMMRINGAHMSAYWIIAYCTYLIIYLGVVALVVLFSLALQWRCFTQNDPILYLLLFLVWGQWVISAAFLLASLFSREKSASVFSYLLVFVCVLSGYVLDNIFSEQEPALWVQYLGAWFPFLAFIRGLRILFKSSGENMRGLRASDNLWTISPNSFTYLYLCILISAVLNIAFAIYFDSVIPSGDGVKKHPLFFIVSPLRWIRRLLQAGKTKKTSSVLEVGTDGSPKLCDTDQDDSISISMVDREVARVLSQDTDMGGHPLSTLRVLEMSKTFPSSLIPAAWRAMLRGKLQERKEQQHKENDKENDKEHDNDNDTAKTIVNAKPSWWIRILWPLSIPDNAALKSLTLEVKKGDCVGLLGPNGSGKTTTLNTLAGVMNPSSGSAQICGADMLSFRGATRKHLGLCPQYDYLSPELTGLEVLMFYGRLRGLHGKSLHRSVTHALVQVNLTFAKNKRCGMYSGGMRRRLSLASALLANPDILLLDEPTTGLDPHSRRDVWECLSVILADHRAVLLATHSMAEAQFLCNRVNIIEKGELKAVGSLEELQAAYANVLHLSLRVPATRASEVEAELRQLAPSLRIMDVINMNREYFIDQDSVPVSDLYAFFSSDKAQHYDIRDWSIRDGSLEDVFNVVTAKEGERDATSE